MHHLAEVPLLLPTRPGLHLYAADASEAAVLATWAERSGLSDLAQMHRETDETAWRPALMALLAEIKPGDLVVAASAGDLMSAPPRARARLATAVKSRAVGFALVKERAGLEQAEAGQVDPRASRAALDRILAPTTTQARLRARGQTRGPVAEAAILRLLHAGRTWSQVQSALGVSRTQVARCAERLAAVDAAHSRVVARNDCVERA